MPPHRDRAYQREEAQTMAEYGVVLSVITLVVVAVLAAFSEAAQHAISGVAALMP